MINSASVVSRMAIGPLADTYGARYTTAGLMVAGSIPVYLTGLVNTANELSCLRFFIGIFGGVFVANQAWSSQMFAKEIVGTANGTSAGWGNLGGGVTHIFMIGIWNLFKSGGLDAEAAWRWCFLVPATICMMCAFASIFLAEDSPKGNFGELVKHGAMVRKSSKKSGALGAKNYNSWLLGMHYAATFGTELVVFNIATSYFHDKFDIELEKAALIAALFG
jgi:MFS transporter, NNP family, nitrate/nitrite transporter